LPEERAEPWPVVVERGERLLGQREGGREGRREGIERGRGREDR
jgi:hypothetical protein